MKFTLRKYDRYAICSIEDGNVTIDLGMLDRKDSKTLLQEFKDAVDELEWFLNATWREGDD
jgi:hypothetical protein